MKRPPIKRITVLVLGICLLCQLLVGFASCGKGENNAPVTAISSVELNQSGDRLKVTATLSESDLSAYGKEELCLFGLEPFQTEAMVSSGRLTPIARSRGAESVRFTVDYTFDNGRRNRLCQRFLLAAGSASGTYTVLTEGEYISNPEVLASRDTVVKTSSLKGLAVSVTEDSTALDPSQVIVDVEVEKYVYASPVKGDTIPFLYGGETLSVCRSAVEALDEQIKAQAAHGSAVYLRFLLSTHPSDLGELSALGYEGCGSGEHYALSLQTRDGTFWITGLFSFLAQRYDSIAGVIPGMAFNDPTYSQNTAATFEAYMEQSLALVRTAYNIFRSQSSGVRVYLPVGNLYTTDEALPGSKSGSREFLAAFASYAKESGDFDWSVYLSMALPSSAADAIWQESGTVNDGSVTRKYILPQTADALFDLLSSDALRYGNAHREMIWGVRLPGNADAGIENQRVSLFYTYMKAVTYNRSQGSSIRAVVWEDLLDVGDRLTGLCYANGSLKRSGELYASLDRGDLYLILDEAALKARLGAKYDEVAEVIDKPQEKARVYEGVAEPSSAIPENAAHTLLCGGKSGFSNAFSTLPGGGVVSTVRQSYEGDTILLATYTNLTGCGVYTDSVSGASLKDKDKLVLTVTAALPEGQTNAVVSLSLESVYRGASLRYTGEGRVTDGNWATLVFSIEEFASKLSDDETVTMTVSLSSAGVSEETPISLYLLSVDAVEARNWFSRGGWILLIVILIAIGLTLFAIWFFHTYEVRWTPGNKAEKGSKPKVSGKERVKRFRAELSERLRVRRRSLARIKVKPGAPLASADADDVEEKDEEELEELLEGDFLVDEEEDDDSVSGGGVSADE